MFKWLICDMHLAIYMAIMMSFNGVTLSYDGESIDVSHKNVIIFVCGELSIPINDTTLNVNAILDFP